MAARFAAAGLGALVLLALGAAPAAADPPRPTNYRSTVVDVTPALPRGVEVRIVGGDSLIELSVPAGRTAIVADYPGSADEEPVPYLRFDADGTVRRNVHAVATTANEARYGTTDRVPDPDADPRWEVVATDGSYAWHDHRIHWMSPKEPKAVDDDGRVDLGGAEGTWSVPLTVDGTPTVITGELVLMPAPSPLGWLALAAVVGAATVAVALRWGLRAGCAVGVAASSAAVIAAVATYRAVPSDAGPSVVPVVLSALALVAAGLGLLGPARFRLAAAAGTAAALLGWSLTRSTVLVRAVLPTDLPANVDRAATAAAIGVGLGLAVVLVWRPAGRPGHAAAAAPVTASPTA